LELFGDRILVVAAHADDKTIGSGGTIAKLARAGKQLKVVVLADGESSRFETQQGPELASRIRERQESAYRALEHLGVGDVFFAGLPDNRMDTISLLEVSREIERQTRGFSPTFVLTHSMSDLNIDHEIALRAVLTACRPKHGSSIKGIASFQVPSSTDLGFVSRVSFRPNLFIEIDNFMPEKLRALAEYRGEVPESKHPRSVEAIEREAAAWGDFAGSKYAEAFEIQRMFH
jgi:LmbE family N-acetylglucosaminyl deacetylase